MAHGKAKLTPAGRVLLVERVERDGWPAAHAAAMAGVSRATAYRWLSRSRNEGLAGMHDRSSRPHSMPGRTPCEREAAVVELRRSWRRGPHLLGGRLGMAQSTVHAVLVRHGLSRLSRMDRVTGDIVRYEREHPGELQFGVGGAMASRADRLVVGAGNGRAGDREDRVFRPRIGYGR